MAQGIDSKLTRILIVDDDDELREELGFALRQKGFLTYSAADPEEASFFIRKSGWSILNKLDCVVLDMHLKESSGLEVLAEIQRIPQGKSRPPVLVFSADSSRETQALALSKGAQAFLGKPSSILEIYSGVCTAMANRRAESVIAAH